MKRLFVAIPLSEEVKERIVPLQEQLKETQAELVPVAKENLHLTLKFLGNVAEKEIPGIVEHLRSSLHQQQKFPLRFQGVGTFLSLKHIKVIWIGLESAELLGLLKRIHQRLDYIRKEQRQDLPHLTIARVKSGKNRDLVQQLIEKYPHQDFGTMFVDHFILYESILTPEGPIYAPVEEFFL